MFTTLHAIAAEAHAFAERHAALPSYHRASALSVLAEPAEDELAVLARAVHSIEYSVGIFDAEARSFARELVRAHIEAEQLTAAMVVSRFWRL